MNPIISQLPDTVQSDWPITQPDYLPSPPMGDSVVPVNPQTPQLFPNEPMFNVPPNPLLPPGYQEVLSYSNLQYLNGFLRTQIGNFCQVTIMIGTNNTTERSGILLAVGINYILLMSEDSNEIETVDFYNIKFVRFRTR
ncbi:MAG: hypothetical protein IJ994_00615 [Firmicutes bacterium]|nr:hypothetical protein [Bacillota bacterium]MBR7147274.1 hypothetical protein [Bacillota bacterium]